MEQNLGNETLEEQTTGAVETVDLGEVEKEQLNEEIDSFFAGKMSDPEMVESEQALAQRAELVAQDNIYEDYLEIYDRMVKEGSNKQGLKLLAAALDLAEIAEKGGIKLTFSLGDFEKIKVLIKQANKEYAAGQLSEQDFKVTVLIIARYVEFIVLMQDEPEEYYLEGLEKKITHAVKTGDLSVLRF